jgi:GLPGLI family protein
MKKILQIIVCFVITGSIYAQKTSGKITYDIAQIDYVDEGKNADFTNMLQMAKKQKYQLCFNKESTRFALVDYMSDENFNEFYNSLAKTYVSYSDFYFDYKNKKVLEDVGDGTILEQKTPKLDWKITSESKTIDHYDCYKATYSFDYMSKGKIVTRVIVAWFAPSLPYPYGPKSHHGLPGLILELTDNTVTFLASKIELSDKQIEIKLPSGTRISKEQFEKAVLNNKF